jgi:hypothetical protein
MAATAEELRRLNQEAASKGYGQLTNKTNKGIEVTSNFDFTDQMADIANRKYREIRDAEAQNQTRQANRMENKASDFESNPTNALYSAISGQTPTNTATNLTSNTTPNVTTQQSTNPLINALRAKIQESIGLRKQQTQSLNNQSEVAKANDLKTSLEQSANMGDRGGIGRQNALATQIAGENRIKDYAVAEQNDITNLQTDGMAKEAEIEENTLRQAIADQQRKEDIAREDARYNQQQNQYYMNYAQQQQQQALDNQYRQSQTDYNKAQDATQNQYAQQQQQLALQQQQQQALQQQAKTLAQAHYNDIQGYINTLQPNDPLIPYLQAERQAKIQNDGLDQNGFKLPIAPKQMSYTDALNTWKAYGIASQEIANILGVPVGAKTTDYQEMQYSTGKPYFAPKSTSGSGSGEKPWYLQ